MIEPAETIDDWLQKSGAQLRFFFDAAIGVWDFRLLHGNYTVAFCVPAEHFNWCEFSYYVTQLVVQINSRGPIGPSMSIADIVGLERQAAEAEAFKIAMGYCKAPLQDAAGSYSSATRRMRRPTSERSIHRPCPPPTATTRSRSVIRLPRPSRPNRPATSSAA